MKKFEFKLQTVHKVREIRRDQETLILNDLQNQAEEAATRVAEIRRTRHQAIEKYSNKVSSGEPLNPMELELSLRHFTELNKRQQAEEAAAAEKRAACSVQSTAVAAASRDVKITSKLYETKKAIHRAETARREQNTIDDIIVDNFARRLSQQK